MKRYIIRYTLISAFLLGCAAPNFAQEASPRFNHMARSVYDLKKSADFYENVLQLDTIPEPFNIGKHKWFRIGPGLALHLINDAPGITDHLMNTHLCLSVPSIDKFVDRLNSFEVPFYNVDRELGKVGTRIDGVHQLYLRDPDGYWIEINDEQMD